MGLRYAAVQTNVQKVHKRVYPNRVTSARLTFEDEGGTRSDLTATISSGMGIITGGNGAGKTTLLRGLSAFGEPGTARWPRHLVSVELLGEGSGDAWRAIAEKDAQGAIDCQVVEGNLPRLTFIDPTEESQDVQRQILADPNAGDLLEGADAYVLDDDWKAHASRVLQRKYDSIQITEFEGPDGSISPWVSVSCEDTNYDLLSMGRGELSALFLLWRLSQVVDNSVVVIDEPESGLAVFAQARLKETLAVISVDRGIQFIITTHSPDMYLGLGGEPVTVLESLPSPIGHDPVSAYEAARALQAPRPPILLCVFTEDVVASALLKAILRYAAPQLSESVEVFYSKNGESALEKVSEEFIEGKVVGRTVRLVTVFDGDQRVLDEGKRSPTDTGIYLPGNDSPEAVLADTVRPIVGGMQTEDLEGIVESVFQFRTVMSREAGSEHHDWFMALSRVLGGHDATSDALLRLCMKDTAFNADVKALVQRLRERLHC